MKISIVFWSKSEDKVGIWRGPLAQLCWSLGRVGSNTISNRSECGFIHQCVMAMEWQKAYKTRVRLITSAFDEARRFDARVRHCTVQSMSFGIMVRSRELLEGVRLRYWHISFRRFPIPWSDTMSRVNGNLTSIIG